MLSLYLSVFLVKDRDTGTSKGFGFITFEKVENAKEAIAGMNNQVCWTTNLLEVKGSLVIALFGLCIS